jgi:ketosteroid isomerase-like protein
MEDASRSSPLPAKALEPGDCDRILLDAFERGDLDTSVALYEPDAVLLRQGGEALTGPDAIRSQNASIIALRPRFSIESIRTTVSGDGTLATTRMKCRFVGRAPDGSEVSDSVHTLEVLRRQPDGTWKYVIDDPYGSMRDGMEARSA